MYSLFLFNNNSIKLYQEISAVAPTCCSLRALSPSFPLLCLQILFCFSCVFKSRKSSMASNYQRISFPIMTKVLAGHSLVPPNLISDNLFLCLRIYRGLLHQGFLLNFLVHCIFLISHLLQLLASFLISSHFFSFSCPAHHHPSHPVCTVSIAVLLSYTPACNHFMPPVISTVKLV